jgi:hypothetical protein
MAGRISSEIVTVRESCVRGKIEIQISVDLFPPWELE